MTTLDIPYVGFLNTVFNNLPSGNSTNNWPANNSQQFFNDFIYGCTSNIIFKYPTNLSPTGASYISVPNIATFTIDTQNGILYYLLVTNATTIYAINANDFTPLTSITLSGTTPVFPDLLYQFFKFNTITNNSFVWVSNYTYKINSII